MKITYEMITDMHLTIEDIYRDYLLTDVANGFPDPLDDRASGAGAALYCIGCEIHGLDLDDDDDDDFNDDGPCDDIISPSPIGIKC